MQANPSIELILKPLRPGAKLHPDEERLLFAYIGEILKEVEIEERKIIEQETGKEPEAR